MEWLGQDQTPKPSPDEQMAAAVARAREAIDPPPSELEVERAKVLALDNMCRELTRALEEARATIAGYKAELVAALRTNQILGPSEPPETKTGSPNPLEPPTQFREVCASQDTPEKSGLSTLGVCAIIETSAKAGVAKLRFGDLRVTFGRPPETGPAPLGHLPSSGLPQPFTPQTESAPLPPMTDLSAEQHDQQNQETLEHEELRLREDQLARALVENPQLYEELLKQGELEDGVEAADPELD